jgi:hypothetical protein
VNPCAIRRLKSPICSAYQRRIASRMRRTTTSAMTARLGLSTAQPKSNEGPSASAPGRRPAIPAQSTNELATTKSKRLRRTTVEPIVA